MYASRSALMCSVSGMNAAVQLTHVTLVVPVYCNAAAANTAMQTVDACCLKATHHMSICQACLKLPAQ